MYIMQTVQSLFYHSRMVAGRMLFNFDNTSLQLLLIQHIMKNTQLNLSYREHVLCHMKCM